MFGTSWLAAARVCVTALGLLFCSCEVLNAQTKASVSNTAESQGATVVETLRTEVSSDPIIFSDNEKVFSIELTPSTEGKKRNVKIPLENQSSISAKIFKAKSSCGCISGFVHFDENGKTGWIDLSIRPNHEDISQSIDLISEDDRESLGRLLVTSRCQPLLEINSPNIAVSDDGSARMIGSVQKDWLISEASLLLDSGGKRVASKRLQTGNRFEVLFVLDSIDSKSKLPATGTVEFILEYENATINANRRVNLDSISSLGFTSSSLRLQAADGEVYMSFSLKVPPETDPKSLSFKLLERAVDSRVDDITRIAPDSIQLTQIRPNRFLIRILQMVDNKARSRILHSKSIELEVEIPGGVCRTVKCVVSE